MLIYRVDSNNNCRYLLFCAKYWQFHNMAENTNLVSKLEELKAKVEQSFPEITDLNVTCKSVLRRHITDTNSINASSLVRIQAVIDLMHEKLNIGNWKEVPLFIRKTVTVASYLRLLGLIKCSKNEDIKKESFKIIDFGLMFGCPLDCEPELLQKCATIINSAIASNITLINPSLQEITPIPDIKTLNYKMIEVINCPSMENFYKNYILSETPVVLENCMNNWPALANWKDQNYFIKLAGFRTVAVELGSKYTDQDWTQKLMTIEEFIKSHIYQSEGPTGYLAQYQLFNQIPELKQDIVEPEYCCFSEKDDVVDINAWYGPKGTVSPLHHDPKKNLLAQVVGEKQLFLFSPLDSEFLYPHEHELLNNTAQIDPRHPDLEKYPKYKEAKVNYCKLKPGQMLYIPPKWWHFVESLSISFSVSFWWE